MTAQNDELFRRFRAAFGEKGGDIFPGNVGESLAVRQVCRDAMQTDDAILYDYFIEWDKRSENERKPLGIELHLLTVGQWEGAWSLAQLHHDQFLKHEAHKRERISKGHPLCNLAIVAREIDSPTLTVIVYRPARADGMRRRG